MKSRILLFAILAAGLVACSHMSTREQRVLSGGAIGAGAGAVGSAVTGGSVAGGSALGAAAGAVGGLILDESKKH